MLGLEWNENSFDKKMCVNIINVITELINGVGCLKISVVGNKEFGVD